MAYNPAVQPRGDQYLFEAISGLGRQIGQGIHDYGKAREESQFLDEQFQGLAKVAAPLIERKMLDASLVDEMAKFSGLSLAQKRGKAASLAFQLNQAMQSERHTENQNLAKANLELNRGHLMLEQERIKPALAQAEGLAKYNRGLAEAYTIPESIRLPDDQLEPLLAAQSGLMTTELATERAKNKPFIPTVLDVGGRKVLMTSKGSAQPLPDLVEKPVVEDWMRDPDREKFIAGVVGLPLDQVSELMALRRGIFPKEYWPEDFLQLLMSGKLHAGGGAPAAGGGAAAPAGGAAVPVTTDAERDALPAGTVYTFKGRRYVKGP